MLCKSQFSLIDLNLIFRNFTILQYYLVVALMYYTGEMWFSYFRLFVLFQQFPFSWQPTIVHRDLKSLNILIDHNGRGKVSLLSIIRSIQFNSIDRSMERFAISDCHDSALARIYSRFRNVAELYDIHLSLSLETFD